MRSSSKSKLVFAILIVLALAFVLGGGGWLWSACFGSAVGFGLAGPAAFVVGTILFIAALWLGAVALMFVVQGLLLILGLVGMTAVASRHPRR